MKRKSISKKASRKAFAKSANRPHPKNIKLSPSRGGIRLGIAIALCALSLTGCKLQIKDYVQSFGELSGEISK